eukprot:763990-Hanusia_phi.AAC.5
MAALPRLTWRQMRLEDAVDVKVLPLPSFALLTTLRSPPGAHKSAKNPRAVILSPLQKHHLNNKVSCFLLLILILILLLLLSYYYYSPPPPPQLVLRST